MFKNYFLLIIDRRYWNSYPLSKQIVKN